MGWLWLTTGQVVLDFWFGRCFWLFFKPLELFPSIRSQGKSFPCSSWHMLNQGRNFWSQTWVKQSWMSYSKKNISSPKGPTGRTEGITRRSPRYQQPRNIPPDPSTSFAINASSAKTMQEMESLVVQKNLGNKFGESFWIILRDQKTNSPFTSKMLQFYS